MFYRLRVALLAAVLATALPLGASASQQSPKEVIDAYHTVILSVMRDAETLGFKGRFDALRPTIGETFNLPLMAQIVAGQYWNRMTDAEKERFVKAFSDFSVANFADRFDDYSGERFETLDEKETNRGDTLVFTQIVKSDGDKVKINYLLRLDGDRWRVIDVYLTGAISELATRRSEYASVGQREGIGGLIDAIQEKVKEMAKEK